MEMAFDFGTNLWASFPEYLIRLAQAAREELGRDVRDLETKFLTTFLGPDTEGLLRRELETIWGCEIYDNYGINEIGGGAFECADKDGLYFHEDCHYFEILDTEPVLRRVCEFCELPWDEAMLSYHERSGERLKEMARALPAEGRAKELSVERRMETHAMTTKPPSADRVARWRTQMSAEQRAEFEAEAGDLLKELGYPVGEHAVEQATAHVEAAEAVSR